MTRHGTGVGIVFVKASESGTLGELSSHCVLAPLGCKHKSEKQGFENVCGLTIAMCVIYSLPKDRTDRLNTSTSDTTAGLHEFQEWT